jgi:hypothetical protein
MSDTEVKKVEEIEPEFDFTKKKKPKKVVLDLQLEKELAQANIDARAGKF